MAALAGYEDARGFAPRAPQGERGSRFTSDLELLAGELVTF
jgi:hypothetical protein